MGQIAASWREGPAAPLDIVPRIAAELPWASTRLSKALADGAGLLGIISEAAHQVRAQTARADAAEARLREAQARHDRTEDEARATRRQLHDMQIRAETAERRAEEMERHLKRAGFAVVEAEACLDRALAEARAERERSGEIQRSSSETVERMRALLNDTEDRLRRATRGAA